MAVELRRDSRVVITNLMILLLPIAVYAQAASQQEDRGKESSLELKLTASAPGSCIGSHIDLAVEVVNAGQENVKVDKNRLWKDFSFIYTNRDGKTEQGSIGGFPHPHKEYIILPPGTVYREAQKLSSELFKSPGSYTIKLHYDTSQSSEAKLELKECN